MLSAYGKLNEHGVMLLKQCAKEVLQHVCDMLGEYGFEYDSNAKKQWNHMDKN